MNEPLVSIVIPFYNNETTLLDAVKSVFIQTYQNWELILLNDGSKDKSLEIANSIKDKRVKVVNDGSNRGLVFRLNQAVSLVSGEYIARMDGDDLMHPERIEKQMKMFLLNPDVDLVDTGAYSIDEVGMPLGIRGLVPIQYDEKFIINNAMLLHASIIGKKEWFIKNKYDEVYVRAEDRELWLRTYKYSKFERVKEPLYIVREGKVNVRNYVQSVKTVREILKVYGPEIFSKKELKKELLKTYLKTFIIKLAGFLNIHDYITRRRNNSLTNEEKNELMKITSQIKNSLIQ
ncbi:glycosyltransferase family 2 protein [Flavobacterium sp. N502540]|uniref:glycosyltransferase family 2 protein n=1 Tax=Flavobacterium sp. N502540 TaxID=2986838 RepID=UPI00222470A1|nr:glycosyltransferase family 2 protein [Flavobacterium sp. N502540]